MGLMDDLMDAKLAGEDIRRQKMDISEPAEPDDAMLKEVELTRDAIINFLTSENLVWTINKLKASVELEEFDSGGALETEVDTSVNTNVSVSNITGAPSGGGGIVPGTGTGTGTGTGEGYGRVTGELSMRKDGGIHGGSLRAIGHAYIGEDDIVPDSDTRDSDNDFTEVRLNYDNIPKDLL